MESLKTVSILFIALFSISLFSQEDVGLKGGLNYNYYGDGTISENADRITSDSDTRTGFHVGGYVTYQIPSTNGLTLRPELIYTNIKTDYKWGGIFDYEGTVTLSKIDVPFLVGKKLAGPLYGFFGPSMQIIIDADFDGENVSNLVYDDFAFGIQTGLGLKVGRLGFDVRWERGLNDSEMTFNRGLERVTIDTRTNQVIFGVSYSFRKNLDNVK